MADFSGYNLNTSTPPPDEPPRPRTTRLGKLAALLAAGACIGFGTCSVAALSSSSAHSDRAGSILGLIATVSGLFFGACIVGLLFVGFVAVLTAITDNSRK